MSTLAQYDEGDGVSVARVGWERLNDWLSHVNTDGKIGKKPPKGFNRGNIIDELNNRRDLSPDSMKETVWRKFNLDRGYSKNWKDYENAKGFTHLEELLIYQPSEWRNQAREYIFEYGFEVTRKSTNEHRVTTWSTKLVDKCYEIPIFMNSPILAVLFSPEMKRSSRYGPINLLLAYGVTNQLPYLSKYISYAADKFLQTDQEITVDVTDSTFEEKVEKHRVTSEEIEKLGCDLMEQLKLELSPLDYFFEYQANIDSHMYDFQKLKGIAEMCGLPRLSLLNELDFSHIVGQRLAKYLIRKKVAAHFSYNSNTKNKEMCSTSRPLSMMFAGPSGIGKTELAIWLSKLLNKPGEDTFHKVDCGKLTRGEELFGLSGAYVGSESGSALNNFVYNLSLKKNSVGVVLFDEIDKAKESVINGLYQVLDKGEWTNKRLKGNGKDQTEVVSCMNIIFIFTANVADERIKDFAMKNQKLYTDDFDDEDLQDYIFNLDTAVKASFKGHYLFEKSFLGRIGCMVPFLPMIEKENNSGEEHNVLLTEKSTVAKYLIEREQEKEMDDNGGESTNVKISPKHKERITKIVLNQTDDDSGIRGIQDKVKDEIAERLVDMRARKNRSGGIGNDSSVTFCGDKNKDHVRVIVDVNSSKKCFDSTEEAASASILNDSDSFEAVEV